MKLQNRSKLITVNPIFNRKEYLGKRTEPLPVERYLIEISYPSVKVAYKEGVYSKQLNELDIEYLVRSKFQGWMQYIMNSHFRMELNISATQAIPKLTDYMTKEEKIISQKLTQNDYELQDAMNRNDISFGKGRKSLGNQSAVESEQLDKTRSKLNKWFPV